MLFQISNGTKYFGVNDVFEKINFEVNEGQKIALIGRNGCGKSTLLKIMTKEEELTEGNVYFNGNIRIGYLSQKAFLNENISVDEAMNEAFKDVIAVKEQLDAITQEMETNHSAKIMDEYSKIHEKFELLGGYNYRNELLMVLTKFGFVEDDLNKKINEFSGGQKTKLAFVKLLISKPDILLLDEPTNHLDLKTIEWLEGYLKFYRSSIVLVSHDRMFIDNIADTIYELELGHMTKYVGNYSQFEEQKRANLIHNHDAFIRQQKEIERLNNLIEKFRYKATKAAFAQSKIKYLEKMEKIEDVKTDESSFKAHFKSKTKGGNNVLEMSNLTVGYDKPLVTVDLKVYRNDSLCIMGDNGAGKSTLVKTLVGLLKPLGGYYLFGHQIEIGYFDQNLLNFNSQNTVLEEVWNDYPDTDQTTIRTLLGNFLFSADDVFKSVTVLSGGEKVRLALCKLVLQQPNVLVLDEPTNHLDIASKEALEEALKGYDGTIILVSHDRYFIKKVCKSILLLENGKATYFPYGYEEFMNNHKEEKKEVVKKEKRVSNPNRTKIRNIENKIDKLEKDKEILENKRFDENYYSDYAKLKELEDSISAIENEIDDLMEQWSELSD